MRSVVTWFSGVVQDFVNGVDGFVLRRVQDDDK